MTTARRAAIVFSCVVVGGLAIFACADDSSFVSLGPSTTGNDAAVLFTPPEDAGAEASAPALLCVTNVCPAPFRTCPVNDPSHDSTAPTYACATNLLSDVHNCGACGNDCGGQISALNVQTSCVNGVCRADCWNLHLDCDGVVDNGCEVDPAQDPNNCGGCGKKCAAGVECLQGVCGCPSGQTDCDGQCVDLTNNDLNCGSCGYTCDDHPVGDAAAPPPNMRHGCKNSQCTEIHCDHSNPDFQWENCNGSLADGCEANVAHDESNCATCGTKCAAGQKCFSDFINPGIACQCAAGRTLCGDSTCTDLGSDPANCGSCGFTCQDPVGFGPTQVNGRTSCDRGRCGYECFTGFADCNGRSDDGCESELAKDPHNCGGCGISCDNAAGQPCVNGQCVKAECDAGTAPQ